MERKEMFRYGELIEVPRLNYLVSVGCRNTAKFSIDFVEEFWSTNDKGQLKQ